MKNNSLPLGARAQVKSEVDAKGGTDRPKSMPVVLIVSVVGAIVAMGCVWAFVFA